MPMKGKPVTFRNGSITLTPLLTTGLANTTAAINLIAKSGSLDDNISVAEANVNCVGKIRAGGSADVSIEVNAFASASGGTGNLTGTVLPFIVGDYINCNLVAGAVNYEGEFIVESLKASLDAADFVTLDISLKNNGDPRTRVISVVTCV
jgi:hypothetical protein